MVKRTVVLNRLLAASQQFWRSTGYWRRRLGHVFYALALIFMGWALWQSLGVFDWRDSQINYQLAVAAQIIVFIVVLLGALNWWLITLAFGFEGAWPWHIRAHLISNIAKYLPGSIWAYLSKGSLSFQAGASKRQVTGAMIVEMVLALASGAILAFFSGWGAVSHLAVPVRWPRSVWLGLGSLMLVAVYFGCRLVVRWSAPGAQVQNPSRVTEGVWLLAAAAVLSVGWLLLAVGLSWLAEAFYVQGAAPLNVYVFSLCVSIVFGILSIFVPNGFGVREGILVLLLRSIVPLPIAFLTALALRISIILGELAAFLLVLIAFSVLLRRNNPIGVLPNGIGRDKVYAELDR